MREHSIALPWRFYLGGTALGLAVGSYLVATVKIDLVVVLEGEALAAVHNVVSNTVVHVDNVVAPSGGDTVDSGATVARATPNDVGRVVARYVVVSTTAEHVLDGVGFPVYGAGAAFVLHLWALARGELDGQAIGGGHRLHAWVRY